MSVTRGACLAVLGAAGFFFATTPVAAQRLDRRAGRVAQPGEGRQMLERQFRERLAEVVKRRLNLSDEQMAQLAEVNDRFERQRMTLLRQERQTRVALRDEVLAGDSANQARVSELLDGTLRIQRQRLELTEQEQRALSAFMTPVQRAMYFGLQDEMRRRMEEFRRQGRPGAEGAVPPAAGRRRPPP